MRLLGFSVRFGIARADRHVAEREGFQDAADTALVHHHEKAAENALPQIE
jgi:hypothetical protein